MEEDIKDKIYDLFLSLDDEVNEDEIEDIFYDLYN